MKLLVAFFLLGILISPVSAMRTKFVVRAKGAFVIDENAKLLSTRLVAKVHEEEGCLVGRARVAMAFVLPDGTKITYREEYPISFEPTDDAGIINCWLDVNGDGSISPTDVLFQFTKIEGTNLWKSSATATIKGYEGTLHLVIELKNTQVIYG